VFRLGRDCWLVGLGALATVGDGAVAVVRRLRDRGERLANDDRGVVRTAYARAGGQARRIRGRVGRAARGAADFTLRRAGVPERSEIRKLIERVETLAARIESIERGL
jgi:hypothetical protein